ncbi:hypothetical protein LIX60_24775 [Streptomyces sp. S07_1.15]|uniref:hypothetical protein n=1 Tax=Streptomyces sp. S07_1.15 TaxID=2873925 RepID=UPI001D155177|nr:hypothetical protein [Streptomyces sp. S07_1.15]MCC3654621.1 hypothetical protein [Streptomyces sp. S07_1.15]
MDVSGAQLRTLRAALFTALCLTLSTAAHVALSAAPLPVGPVAAVAAGVFLIAYALAGRERGLWSIAALLVPLELAADTVFTTGQHTCYGESGGPVAGPLRSLGVDLLCGGGTLGTPLARMTAPGDAAALPVPGGPATPWLLLAAHAAVGLTAAVWLWRGEAALGRLLRALAAFAFRPLLLAVAALVPAGPAPRRGPHGPRRPVAPGRLPMLVYSVVRRGPPAVAAVR